MKRNYLRSGALALMITLSGAAFGGNGEIRDKETIKTEKSYSLEVKIFPRSNGMVAVNFRKQIDETVTVKIFTFDGEKLYNEKVRRNEIVARRYDLSQLPDGYYYFEVTNGNYLVRQLVNKKN